VIEFTEEELEAYVLERVTRAVATLIRDTDGELTVCPQCVATALDTIEPDTMTKRKQEIQANFEASLKRAMQTLGGFGL
jgi:hypothetical protein